MFAAAVGEEGGAGALLQYHLVVEIGTALELDAGKPWLGWAQPWISHEGRAVSEAGHRQPGSSACGTQALAVCDWARVTPSKQALRFQGQAFALISPSDEP